MQVYREQSGGFSNMSGFPGGEKGQPAFDMHRSTISSSTKLLMRMSLDICWDWDQKGWWGDRSQDQGKCLGDLRMLVGVGQHFLFVFAAEILLYIYIYSFLPDTFLGGLRHVKPVEQPRCYAASNASQDSHNLGQLDPNSICLAISNIKSWKTMGHVWPPKL